MELDNPNAPGKQWSVVIDTDSYSGNFEREMVAFITGYETPRGDKFVYPIRRAFGFESRCYGAVWDEADENPFVLLFIPWPGNWGEELAHICPTPGYGNNGRGEHCQVTTPAQKTRYPYPAFQSVQIRCSEKPSAEALTILKEWSYKFAERSRAEKPQWNPRTGRYSHDDPFVSIPPLNIIGFRLICEDRNETISFAV
jgi:hypothetical protein